MYVTNFDLAENKSRPAKVIIKTKFDGPEYPIGDCELIIYPIDSNAKSLLFDSLLCMPGNTKAIKIYLNFKPKDR